MLTLKDVLSQPDIVVEVRNLAVHAVRCMGLPPGGSVSVSDLSSALLTKLWQRVNLPEFCTREEGFAYLMVCLKNHMKDALERRSHRPRTVPLPDAPLPDPADPPDPLEHLRDDEATRSAAILTAFDRAFEQLAAERDGLTGDPMFSHTDFAIIRGKRFLGLTYPALARQFGLTEGQVEAAYNRVAPHLRAHLNNLRPDPQ